GLPHRLGRRASSVLAPLVLMLAVLVVAVGPGAFGGPGGVGSPGSTGGPGGLGSPGGPVRWVAGLEAVGVAAAAGIVGWRGAHSRARLTLSMAVAAICVLLWVQAGAGTMDGS